jgi:hypothetical protein
MCAVFILQSHLIIEQVTNMAITKSSLNLSSSQFKKSWALQTWWLFEI